ncbi:hypothetical protein BGZ99_008764 [Dissophora globulifera]|uniref:Male-enhanced antigen 1 n=1 Tax=Dissophora globulifera TaxID=979702 RepID=A0A9P6RV52_9FUNG|nr:hypothetical protein BGZ99_008764 [Dissophora globulifera]
MQTNEQGDEVSYEVGQEQLDAVDRMLEELDLEERFDRVPAAFQIVERLEQQRIQQQHLSRLDNHYMENILTEDKQTSPSNDGIHIEPRTTWQTNHDMEIDVDHSSEHSGEESDDEEVEVFGYIPLDQGDDGNGDIENGFYAQMESDDEGQDLDDTSDNDDDKVDEGQGYDGYLRSKNRDGTVPVPVIPQAVAIELEKTEIAAEPIPEDDLKTIFKVMNSFSLPAPEWAKSIPEERWLPKIVQLAEAESEDRVSAGAASSAAPSSSFNAEPHHGP